jgi:hypothetical protein
VSPRGSIVLGAALGLFHLLLSFLGLRPTGAVMSAPSVAPVDPSAADQTRRLAKRLALAVDSAVPATKGVVVLAYHRVGARTASPVDLPTKLFRRQLAHLAAIASVESLDDVIVQLDSADAIVERQCSGLPAALTFDDGTADFVDIVLPMLVEYRLPATLYLSTSFVDSGQKYPADGTPISWSGLREVVSTGLVTIGAHTHNHVLLDRCDPSVAADELDRCNDRILAELGIRAEHFAYPKAVAASGDVEAVVKRRYRTAAVAGTRANSPLSFNRYRLFRSPIQVADGWEGFVRKLGGGLHTEDDLRRVLNIVRYRGRTT